MSSIRISARMVPILHLPIDKTASSEFFASCVEPTTNRSLKRLFAIGWQASHGRLKTGEIDDGKLRASSFGVSMCVCVPVFIQRSTSAAKRIHRRHIIAERDLETESTDILLLIFTFANNFPCFSKPKHEFRQTRVCHICDLNE